MPDPPFDDHYRYAIARIYGVPPPPPPHVPWYRRPGWQRTWRFVERSATILFIWHGWIPVLGVVALLAGAPLDICLILVAVLGLHALVMHVIVKTIITIVAR